MTSHGEAETAAQGRTVFAKLHARLGDFWWYSLMLFCACRAADLLNAFVGLWLVPEYVDQSELGAIMPLANFASFLAIPVAAFANTFRNELTRLSIAKEFGKLKSLMRGVFTAAAIFLFVAIVVARLLLPAFLERIRIVEGSLGVAIIASSFITAVSPIYSNALQALKKFKAHSLLSIAGAPVRLLTMLAAMPFRALTGYFTGQASPPLFAMIASVFALRKELSVKAKTYWTKEIFKKFSVLLALFLAWGLSSGFCSLIEATIIRQRLPDLDSAGYYMVSRFAEIATYLYCAMSFVFFPFAAEHANNARKHTSLVLKATGVNLLFCVLIAVVLGFAAKPALAFLPHGKEYAAYWWAVPWMVAISGISSLHGFYTTAETAATRFCFLKWTIPLDLSYPAILLIITGHGYFTGIIPASWSNFLTIHNIYSLSAMLWWMTALNIIKSVCCLAAMAIQNRKKQTNLP